MPYENKPMKKQWLEVDGRMTPIVLPQIWSHEKQDWVVTSENNRLPVDVKLNQLDEIVTNQREIINTLHSDKLIYGAYWDKTSKSTLKRTDAAVGMVAEVGTDGELVRNDFDRAAIWGEIEEVMDSYGNYFMRIPKFYIRKISGKDFRLTQVSKTRYPGFYLPWVFWDFDDNKELDYYDHAKYKASLSDDGKLESKPDKQPLISKNIVQFRNYAQSNNDDQNDIKGYQQLDIHAQDVLTTLFEIEFATIDSQSIMRGFVSGPYSDSHVCVQTESQTNRVIVSDSTAGRFVVGQSISLGTSRASNSVFGARELLSIDNEGSNKVLVFDGDPVDVAEGNVVASRGWESGFSRNILASSGSVGSNTSGKYPCMYRGIESPWGDLHQFVDGININDYQAWVTVNANDYASNVFAFPYEKLGYINSDTNGWVREMGFDESYPFAEFPIRVGGNSSSYYADNYYRNTGARVARVGGRWSYGSYAGLRFWSLASSSSFSAVNIGGRLLKKAS